jgi:hypothetical protein
MRNQGWIAAVVLLCTGLAGVSSAAPVSPISLQIDVDGVMAGTYDETQIGCSAGTGDTFRCAGTSTFGGDYGMSMTWDMTFDADPVITGITAVTNLSASPQQFTLIFTLPTTVAPASLMGGGVQGGVTDNTGDGATISAPTGSALYTALIDSVLAQQAIYSDPFSYNEPNAFQNSNFAAVNWGTPIPSAPGPAVAANIRIRLDFILTGNDSASLTSNFVVVPVPEPATGLMLALGLGALALRRRR